MALLCVPYSQVGLSERGDSGCQWEKFWAVVLPVLFAEMAIAATVALVITSGTPPAPLGTVLFWNTA
jgi:hypothetical protein